MEQGLSPDQTTPTGDRPASLNAAMHVLTLPSGLRVVLYHVDGRGWQGSDTPLTPLLLVHSIHATASAFEMEPVVLRQSRLRPVVALDLPGFGASDKPGVPYTPALMQEAVVAAMRWTQAHAGPGPMDVMALSLGCEIAAQAALRYPALVRTLTLISPTGMEARRSAERFENGRTRVSTTVQRLLHGTRLGRGLYRLLTTRTSINWFLSRTWGTPVVDPRLVQHGRADAIQAGAEHAPLDFVAGALFTRGIVRRYRALPVPVWVAHGKRGSFTDFGACPERTGAATGRAGQPVVRSVFDAGAMPHFELADAFDAAYQRFLQGRRAQLGSASLRTSARLGSFAVTRPY